MKTRYIVEHQFLSSRGETLTVEHGITYETIQEAANGQRDHILNTDHTCVGFRIIELREVEHETTSD